MRPICINHGCSNPVAYSRRNPSDGSYRWRIHCSHCQSASYGKWPHRHGVVPFKKHTCSNVDGKLGWQCPTNFKFLPKGITGITEVDHIDGNHSNNNTENLQELCMICHKIKGKIFGDFDNTKSRKTSRYAFTLSSSKAFDRWFECED